MSSGFANFVIASLLFVVLIFFSAVGVLDRPIDWGRKGVEIADYPVVFVLSRVNNFFRFVFSLSDLGRQNQLLTTQVGQLTAEVASLQKAERENKQLRESLNFLNEADLQLKSAEVISFDPLTLDQKIVINRGRNDGIREGAAVVISGRILVGVVSEVFEGSSNVELISSSGVTVNAESAERGVTGVVRGGHGLGLLFDLVSQNDSLAPHHKIITSGLGGKFPRNLLIGEISEISRDEGLFQKATIVPAADLHNLRFVFVVLNPPSQ